MKRVKKPTHPKGQAGKPHKYLPTGSIDLFIPCRRYLLLTLFSLSFFQKRDDKPEFQTTLLQNNMYRGFKARTTPRL